MARRERQQLTPEAKELVDRFREERRARNLRALAAGTKSVGGKLRGKDAPVDTDFILGGSAGRGAWKTPDEKMKELAPLELQKRQEDIARFEAEANRRQQEELALLNFMQRAYEGAANRAEAAADRDLKMRIHNSSMTARAAQGRAQKRTDRSKEMAALAEEAGLTAQGIEAKEAERIYLQKLEEKGISVDQTSKEWREGKIYDAPVVNATIIAEASKDNPEMSREDIIATEARLMAEGASPFTDKAQHAEDAKRSKLVAEQQATLAQQEAATGRESHKESGLKIAVQNYTGNLKGNPADALDSEQRVELNMAMSKDPYLRGSQLTLEEDDLANWERERARATSTAGAAAVSARRLVQANPEAFDPSATAQLLEAARLLGRTTTKTAEEAITAAQESAGREGVSDTQEIAAASQVEQRPEEQEGWLGIPGMEEPPDPRDKAIRAMELIEQFPEKPQVYHLRDQLTKSKQFNDYKTKLGYGGLKDRQVINYMVKDARKADRDAKQAARRAVKENQDLGITPKDRPDPEKREPKEPEAPVNTGDF